MARRRMISEEMLYDEQFNSLSLEAQNLFLRMLAKSDDCGVIPASDYSLSALLNLPDKLKKNLRGFLGEIVKAGMGVVILHQEKQYFLFKSKSFLKYQSYIINKRLKSEYLDITADEFDSTIWQPYDEHMTTICPAYGVVSSKKKVESREQKVESRASYVEDRGGVFENDEVWAKWGEFKEHRREQKHPMTPKSIKNSMETIREHSQGNPKIAVEMLRDAMAKGWRGIFPLNAKRLDEIRRSETTEKCHHCNQRVSNLKHHIEYMCLDAPKPTGESVKAVGEALNLLSKKMGVR